MWRVKGQNGRIAWFAGDDPAALAEMVAELFGDPSSVTIDEVDVVERGDAEPAG